MTPFLKRHLGPDPSSQAHILAELGYASSDDLVDAVVPKRIRLSALPDLPEALDEKTALSQLAELLGPLPQAKSFIGQGYYGTVVPPVIQRNVLENPGWYTAYTPYQAEISQGRLEALLNFQTLVTELTGMDVANASLLDEGTAAAEAVSLAAGLSRNGNLVWVDEECHPQTIEVVRTRAEAVGMELEIGNVEDWQPCEGLIAALVQYPSTVGTVRDFSAMAEKLHEIGAQLIVAADLLALTLFKEPGAMGADLCVGSTQRFGVPMGFGGPHAAYLAVRDALKRKLPGRLVGVSKDSQGRSAFRLSLQTREQHIRRDKATSNICTAQVLLAVMAAMYAVWHGPEGLKKIAREIHRRTATLAASLNAAGVEIENSSYFDTLTIRPKAPLIVEQARERGLLLRDFGDGRVGISLDETTTDEDLKALVALFESAEKKEGSPLPETRETDFLTQAVFHQHQSETGMMRYLHRLERKDLALNQSMIPLGSCTMKLNPAASMMPLSWPQISQVHPFTPDELTQGYRRMLHGLADWLCEITGFAAVSLQPNAGSQGEYAGLLTIRSYHESRGDVDRKVCLIPSSAHGTNPASAVMAGYRVVAVRCDEKGNVDREDLSARIAEHRNRLAALMVTYPSTHGVFEEGIQEICQEIHEAGGQVYLDGANLNAQVCVTSPAAIGADVCHLNLHKTFCIPHGGGGPGVGPVGVAAHLVEHLPQYVSAAPYGSASINSISWMYLAMMGAEGLKEATAVAILNANYMAHRLAAAFPILYTGRQGLVAHECIIDLRAITAESGITVEDVAKRLIDYGFHAPTMSWPVAGTLMIEPTESESLAEIDRYCEALLAIREEIAEVISGVADREDNVLKNAPHTAEMIGADKWTHPYSREKAAWPVADLRQEKYWAPVGRVDNVHGDRNLVCTCDAVDDYAS